ncbi:MAG TPA: BCR, YceG family protein, partial [Alcanivorax sp.]|nr:BCR, YceG family protein [Alcanivorax sp.]
MFGLLLLLLLVGIPLAGFWVSGYLHRPLPLEEPVLVEVAPGSSFNGLLAGM